MIVFYVFPRQVFQRVKLMLTDFRVWVIIGVIMAQAWGSWAVYHSYAKFNLNNEHKLCGLAKAFSHNMPKTLLDD